MKSPLFIIMIVLIAPFQLRAESPTTQPGLTENAALSLWPAFHFLPKDDSEDSRIIGDWEKVPLDANTAKVVQSQATALRYLHLAGAAHGCDWGLNRDEGLELLLPFLSQARELASLGCLRARMRFEANDHVGAVDDAMDVMALGRHCGACDLLIGLLVEQGIENTSLKLIARNLDAMDGAGLRRLSERLNQLPPRTSLRTCVLAERQLGPVWFIKRIKETQNDPDWFKQVFGPSKPTPGQLDPDVIGKNPQAVIDQLEKMLPQYDALAAATLLPPPDAETRLAEVTAKMRQSEVGAFVYPAVDRVYRGWVDHGTRIEALKAEVADQLANRK